VEYLKKSKLILLFSAVVILISLIRLNLDTKSKYNLSDNYIEGTILEKKIYDNRITFAIKGKEKVLVNCYECEINPSVGDHIKATGIFKMPNKNTVFYLFNYKNYLKSKKINYIFITETIEITKSTNLFYKIKNFIINRVNNIDNDYLNTFILGVNELDDDIYSIYQNNGISHLFAVSGMHISLLTSILVFLLSKIIKNKPFIYILISVFLTFYMFLTNFTPSVIRSSLLFIGISFNKIFKLNPKTLDILLIILNVLLIYNPFYFYNISFLFSFTISIYLIIFNNLFSKFNNYFIKIFLVSMVSFLVSLPIVLNNFFSVNVLSPVVNIIAVPLISVIIFPLALITFVFPIFNNILLFALNIFENICIFFSKISFNINFGHMSVISILIYYFIITSIFMKFKLYKIVLLILFLIVIYNINYFNLNTRITFIDVNQGDSTLLQMPFNQGNILIDTGGSVNYDLSKNTLVPYLKANNIKKLDSLILTHGDFDHMGEAINLVNNFKIEKVIFNCGELNDLEQDLTKVLNDKNIPYYSCIKELNIDDNKLYFLNSKDYGNENDNSSVVYTEFDNYKFLFMGDAGIDVEEDLIKRYNLKDIAVLKVGHHGSKTSSSRNFIDEINPKYSIISVGKNNRYGHPNKKVLNNLEDSRIYRTDQAGSVMFKIKNNKLKIETCAP